MHFSSLLSRSGVAHRVALGLLLVLPATSVLALDLSVVHNIKSPTRLARGPEGKIYVTDPGVGSVFICDASLAVIQELKYQEVPLGIAVGVDGTMYVGSRGAKNAIAAAINYYEPAGELGKGPRLETREMILLVIDRIGDYKKQQNVMCPYPKNYEDRQRRMLEDRYGIPRYQEKLDEAKIRKKTKQIKKWENMIKRYQKKVKKDLVKVAVEQPCYKLLKMVIEDETNRRVKGVWQINRDARNSLGRLMRRSRKRYDDI